MIKEKIHSHLGASSAKRWLNCPGSIRIAAGLPRIESAFALEGTAAHELSELVFESQKEKFNTTAYTFQGQKIKGVEVTLEMATHVQGYVDYVKNLHEKTKGELKIEHGFKLANLHPDFFGTCDAVIMQHFGELHVIDFKYGAGLAVDVVDNEQLKYYALGALSLGDFSEVHLHIYQPRVTHKEGIARTWKTTPGDLVEFGKVLKAGAIATQNPNAPLVIGDHCRFCPAMATCPKQAENALATAKTDFRTSALPEITELNEADLVKVITQRKSIESWFDKIEEFLLLKLMRGEKVPGLKLVEGRTNREWVSQKEAERFLKSKLADNAYSKKLLSPAQAEKFIDAELFSGLVIKKAGKPTVAPESDKRKSMTDAIDDFSNIEVL